MKCQTVVLLMIGALLASSATSQSGLWSPSQNISNNNYGSGDPAIAMWNGNHIYIVWSDNSRLGTGIYNWDILYKIYNGQAWSNTVQLSAYEVTTSRHPRIAVDTHGQPHVVWVHHELSDRAVYYSTLTDTGWTTPFNLSYPYTNPWSPDIAIDSQDHVHVFFSNGVIYHHEFNGFEWLPIDTIIAMPQPCDELRVAIDTQDHIHLTWEDWGNFGPICNIGYAVFDGNSWSIPSNLSLTNELYAEKPDIALDSYDQPHVLWEQHLTYTTVEVFYSFRGGATWSWPSNISNHDTCEVYETRIAISDSGVKHILYGLSYRVGQSDVSRVVHRYCQDNIWSSPDTIVNGAGSLNSDLALGVGNVLHTIVPVNVSPGNSEIFYQYTTAGTTSLVNLLTPYNPPITIPAGGGSFQYDLRIENVQVLPLHFDLWTDVLLPNGHVSRTFLYRPSLNINAGAVIQRFSLTQNIPAVCPPGVSYYRLMAGEYPDVVVAADSFAFTKEGFGDWGLGVGEDWTCSENLGIDVGAIHGAKPPVGELPLQCGVSPNPFNPTTTISFQLEASSYVSLKVYDTAGRLVETLVEGGQNAGQHIVAFNGSTLPSGIYLYVLQADDFSASGKMALLK